MRNRFSINEEEKNRIRGLHLTESKDKRVTSVLNEEDDAGFDTPGGNPEYFYGDGSLDKLRNNKEISKEEISKEEIIKILKQIHTLQHEDAPAIAQRRLEELFGRVGIGTDRDADLEDFDEWMDDLSDKHGTTDY